jgi:hypothetical protein
MPRANSICKCCGKEYYVCYSCVSINSYKRLFCSPQCYRTFLHEEEKNKKKKHKSRTSDEIYAYMHESETEKRENV